MGWRARCWSLRVGARSFVACGIAAVVGRGVLFLFYLCCLMCGFVGLRAWRFGRVVVMPSRFVYWVRRRGRDRAWSVCGAALLFPFPFLFVDDGSLRMEVAARCDRVVGMLRRRVCRCGVRRSGI